MLENARKVLRISSMREQVTPAEWQARIDCAACYRLVAHYGMADMMANHISVRVPGEEAFLINPYGMMYEEMTASALIKVDIDGNILGKPDYGDFDFGINRAGYVIHSAIHGAKHELDCVIHTHTWPGMAISSLECGLLPMTQTAMRFARISYHEYEGVVLNTDEQTRLIANLGDNNAMILRNHGLLTVGRTVGEAFNALHRLELSCKAQIAAMSCNTPLHQVPQAVLDATYQNYQPNVRRPYGVMEWPALLRMLDRLDPSYAD
ncbi:Ribulose-5-phosphate 4-epimerase/Fuculose-1-phosphate aldolase [Roseomonas rosea]|uniref:Ribulose-5-phosphate 4-epimerase/Fuculose-1-phosphate aldolase n=1 Tax=Muricoccus roseus TaxID=198092 RepID=A0A1M6MNY6_9PROT|nr:class II aldolase/adducin family protein [Roseomonas rosea]SHJ85154.1 Ribulose-5-phosphate 4-epimerase/Fuculose-1-phosphate aldolase [Roseomonas rosea]